MKHNGVVLEAEFCHGEGTVNSKLEWNIEKICKVSHRLLASLIGFY